MAFTLTPKATRFLHLILKEWIAAETVRLDCGWLGLSEDVQADAINDLAFLMCVEKGMAAEVDRIRSGRPVQAAPDTPSEAA